MKKLFTLFTLFITMLFTFSMVATENLVTNGNFEDGTNGWTLTCQNEADENVYVVTTTEDGLTVSQTTAASGRLDISQDITIEQGVEYSLSFDYKATHKKFRIWSFFVSDNDVWVYLGESANTDEFRTNNGYYDVTSNFSTINLSFTAPTSDTLTTFRLMFRVYKQANSSVSLRNVSLTANNPVTDAIDYNNTGIDQQKFIKDGMLYFRKGDNIYNSNGMIVE